MSQIIDISLDLETLAKGPNAVILAEIERLDRAEARQGGES